MQYYHAILDGGNITELQYRHCTLALNQDLLGSTPSSVTMKFLPVVLLLTACFGQGNYLPEEPEPTQLNVKETVSTVEYTTAQEWYSSPWYRQADMVIEYPVLLAVAMDGTACTIPAKVWAVWQRGRRVHCANGWRFPR